MHLLQGEHHPCQRRVKCRGQSGSGPAGEKELLLCLPPVQSPGDPFARHGAKLNGRALPSQGEPSQQTQESSQEFGRQDPVPLLLQFPGHLPLQLGDPAS